VAHFLSIFGALNPSVDPDVIAQNTIVCGKLYQPLSMALGHSADGIAQSRLAQLYLPKAESVWQCIYETPESRSKASIIDDGDDGDDIKTPAGTQTSHTDLHAESAKELVTLRYKVGEGSQMRVQYHHSPELLDFQSNVVLAKAADKDGPAQKTIDTFLLQFSWMRRLAAAMASLHAAGHFDYFPMYKYECSTAIHADELRNHVLSCEATLLYWNNTIERIRKEYYFVNFFTVKQCHALLRNIQRYEHLLAAPEMSAEWEQVHVIVANYVCLLNVDAAADHAVVETVSRALFDSWSRSIANIADSAKSTDPSSEGGAANLFRRLAISIEIAFALVPRRQRAMHVLDLRMQMSIGTVTPGINIVLASDHTQTLKAAMALYASKEQLPEWENCVVCDATTNAEEIVSFLYRWHGCTRYRMTSPGKALFALVGVASLPYDVQLSALKLLKELISAKSPDQPIAFISHEGDQSHLITSFSHRKVSIGQTSSKLWRMFGAALGEELTTTWASKGAGAGKTFNIRTFAHSKSLAYVHVPINLSCTTNEVFIRRLSERLDAGCHEKDADFEGTSMDRNENRAGALLHLDVASYVNQSFIIPLFQLCFLGVVQNVRSPEHSVFYRKSHTFIAIELAAEMQDSTLTNHCSTYNLRFITPSADTFAKSGWSLMVGMGDDFQSSLYDGLAKDPDNDVSASNAYQRLEYVVCALHVLRTNAEGVPFDFDSKFVMNYWEENPDGFRYAYELVVDACKLGLESKSPSLWCVWSFVNVLYWQLRDMHHPESPLNGCCMPDASRKDVTAEKDADMKTRIKMEIVKFIVRTAREFATRQLKETEEARYGQVHKVTLSGWTRAAFNKTWCRLSFDNDGQPCFQCGSYYLYYRMRGDCWVIDDVIYPSGTSYAISTNGDINSRWTSSPTWKNVRGVIRYGN
jgi:hypothetical protein